MADAGLGGAVLREGLRADTVVFDPAAIAERGDDGRSHAYPVGLDHVLVNGQAIVRNGGTTGPRGDAVLRIWREQ